MFLYQLLDSALRLREHMILRFLQAIQPSRDLTNPTFYGSRCHYYQTALGMKQLPKKSGEFLFEIIMRRHELRSTMMTSNRPLEDWGKLIGDVPAATAILDRFLQDAELIKITGRSYRLRGRSADKPGSQSKPAKGAHSKSKTGQSKTTRPSKTNKANKN